MKRPYRRHLGDKFNEGARLSWLLIEKRGLTAADLQRAVGAGSGTITRLLYGDSRPGRGLADRIAEFFGLGEDGHLLVPATLWDTPPAMTFTPPAARRDGERVEGRA